MMAALTELIQPEELSLLFDDFFQMTGMAPCLLDPLTGATICSHFQYELCRDFHQCQTDTRAQCLHLTLPPWLDQEGKKDWKIPHIHRCGNQLMEAVTGLYHEEALLALVCIGQVFTETPDPKTFLAQAKARGFDAQTYLSALEEIPQVTEEELLASLNILKRLTGALLRSGLERYRAREAEEETRQQRTLLKTMMDAIPDLVFFKNREGRYLGCNRSFERFAGQPENELVGKSDFDLFPPDVAAFFREKDQRMFAAGTPLRNEEWVTFPDGQRLLLDTVKTPFFDQRGKSEGLIGVSRDITELSGLRENMERSLQQARADLNLFSQGPVMIVRWRNEEGWPVSQISENLSELLGYERRDLLEGRLDYHQLIHPEDRQRVAEEVKEALEEDSDRIVHEPYRLKHLDGSYRWFLDYTQISRATKGKILFFQGYLVDITSLIDAQEALRTSRERLALAMEGGNLGRWDWNIATGKVIYDPQWAKMLGYQVEELEPDVNTWSQLVHPDDLEAVQEVLERHLRGDLPFYRSTHRLRTKQNQWIWVLDTGRVLERDPNGLALRAAGVHVDITEQQTIEEERKASEQRLKNAEQLAKLGHWEYNFKTEKALWSSEVYRIFGLDPAEFQPTAQGFFQCILPADRPGAEQHFWQAFQERVDGSFSFRIQRPDGTIRQVQEEMRFVLDAQNQPLKVEGTVQDVTEQRTIEMLLRQSEDRLKRAEAMARLGHWELDFNSETLFWSDQVFDLLGLDPQQFTPTLDHFLALLPESDRNLVAKAFALARTRGTDYELDHRIQHRDGTTLWVHEACTFEKGEDGAPVKAIGTIQDISAQRRASQQLLDSESRLKTLFDTIEDAIFVHAIGPQHPSGTFVEVNRVACQRLGYRREELLSLAPKDITAEFLGAFDSEEPILETLHREGSVRFSALHRKKEGSTVPVEIQSTRFSLNGTPMVLSVARDISETLAQQRNLAQTLTQLQALIGNLQMGILVESADRHILQSNEFFCKIFGIPDPDILSGLDCSLAAQGAAKHFLDPAGFLSDIDRILAKGATVVNERLHMADGRTLERDYVPVFVHDQFSGNMWIYRDITQQEQHRQQLQETNQRLRTLINATPDIICFKDGKGRWLEANQADLELFCLTEVDYRGKTDRELAAFTDPLYRNAFLACEESDEVCWTSQKVSRGVETIPQVNGPAKVYDVIKVPLFDQQHQRKGLVVLGRDVTDRETLQTQLVRQERLAAVGQLSAGIAHDFNNILASIMGHAELLQFLPQVPGEVLPYCKQIADSSQRAANLVRQILDFSQKTMREPKEIALNQVVEKAVGFLRSTLPENIHIDFTPHPQPLTILGDASQLQQVITNLGVNAKFAMPEGGTLNVSLSLDQMIPQQPCMVCGQTFSGTFATLTVSDTGVGIPQELMAKIFEPFFTTREVGQGSGLGLSQVAGIVSQHKAHLQLTSALGQGSTFRLFFPPHQSLLPQTTPPAKTSSLPLTRGQGELILVVEDDLTVLRTIKAILNHLGYRVLDTETGQEALRLFQQHQAQIGMVLTDMVMPDMDGETLFWKLRAVDPNLKVVVMTGYPLKDRGQTLSQQGVFAWLEKPLSVALLSQTLAEALGHPKGRWG